MTVNNIIGTFSVPTVLLIVGLLLFFGDGDLFSEFLKGARDGAKTCIELLPTLVLLMTTVGMLRASGAIEGFAHLLGGPLSRLGIPAEIIPTVMLRPISGSAANAAVASLFAEHHPDSFAGRCVSVLMGSSDTVVYTLSMYFGSVGIRKTRHAIPAAILTHIACTLLSVYLVRLFF